MLRICMRATSFLSWHQWRKDFTIVAFSRTIFFDVTGGLRD